MAVHNRRIETKIIRTRVAASGHQEQITPIYVTSGFNFASAQEAAAVYSGLEPGYVYSRWENPNNDELIARMCLLEEGDAGLTTASGMAAIFTVLAALLNSGDHVVATSALFSATSQILEGILPRWGIESSSIAARDPASWEAAFRPRTRVCIVETPSNPGLELVDIAALAELCRARDVVLVVDNTFATPALQRPLTLGADLVLHSTTKFLDGQGRTIGGVIVGDQFIMDDLVQFAHTTGPTLSSFNAWILSQALELLPLRMAQHSANALELARWLEDRVEVRSVLYPYLESHPQHELARRQMSAGGGIVTFELDGGLENGRRFLDALQMGDIVANLGDVRTIVTHPASTTHSTLSAEERRAAGISDGMVRVSVGLEHIEDILADFDLALGRAQQEF